MNWNYFDYIDVALGFICVCLLVSLAVIGAAL